MTHEFRLPLILAVVLLVLSVLYVGSYLALVVPHGYVDVDGLFRRYRYNGGNWPEQIFLPLEQIDRKVRPEVWRRRLADPYDYTTH